MADTPKPVLLFTVSSAPDSDVAELDSNYGDVNNAVPSDIRSGLTNASQPLSGNQTVLILSAKTNWLIRDNSSRYQVKEAGGDLNVYSITSGLAGVLETQAKTANGVIALTIITAACHSIQNTKLTPPKVKPPWFDDLNAKLDAAKVLATEWVDDLSVDMTAKLPSEVINYGSTYTAVTAQIVKIADANPTASGKDNQAVQEVFALIDALKTQVGQIHGDLELEDGKLKVWGDKMQAAHDDLFDGVANIQAAETDLQTDINKMNSAIKGLHERIDGENKAIAAAAAAIGIGIFIALIGIALMVTGVGAAAGAIVLGIGAVGIVGGAVTWGIMQGQINAQFDEIAKDQKKLASDKQQLVALQGLSVATNQAVSSIAIATSALSSARTMWKVFEGELKGSLDKLNMAQEDLALIVNEAFVNGAAEEWKLAEQFARELVAPTFESKELPMQEKGMVA